MGTAAATTGLISDALRIVSSLQPASVLGIGSGAGALMRQLERRGVAAVTHADSAEQLSSLADTYDLAVCSDTTANTRSLIAGAAARTHRILFLPSPDAARNGSLLPVLRLFEEAGLSPDFSTDPAFLTNRAILFHRNGNGLDLSLASELIHLNSTIQECLSRVSEIQGRLGVPAAAPATPAGPAPPDRQAELERLVNELSAAVAETREMQQAFAERMEGRVALLQSRTMRVQHDTQAILRSRIWRALVAGGGLLLRLQGVLKLGAFQRPAVGTANGSAASETIFRMDCDEPVRAADSGEASAPTAQ